MYNGAICIGRRENGRIVLKTNGNNNVNVQSLQQSLQNLQDASDDLMMFDDDSLLIPYMIGDVFISHSQKETQEMLEAAKVCPKLS